MCKIITDMVLTLNKTHKALILLGLFFLTACQNNKKPDLAHLYLDHSTDDSNTPLIIIHGTMGSKLRDKDSKEELWIGNLKKLAFSKYREIALGIDPNTLTNTASNAEAHEILDSISGIKLYEDLIDIISAYGGYHFNDEPNQSISQQRNAYLFIYDWRQDNVHSAQQLSSFIDQVRHANDDKPVDIVAHSMGGLITRYYLRYKNNDVLNDQEFQPTPQNHQVRHVIFLGTPNLGSVRTVNRFVNGFQFNLRTIPIEVLVTLPSVYQLLPFDQDPWLYNIAGQPIDWDIYDINTWIKNHWAVFDPEVQKKLEEQYPGQLPTYIAFFEKQIKRAERFWQALSTKQSHEDVAFIVFGGDCKKTPDKLVFERTNGVNALHLKPSQIEDPQPDIDYHRLMVAPGDGQVTKASLLGKTSDPNHSVAVDYPIFLCENHLKLTNNINFQDNLLHILLQ